MHNKELNLSIKFWADDDRPREKLLRKGRSALSDAELIAILIGSGSRDESAVQLSKRILAAAENNLNKLGKLTVKQLMQFKGIGVAKAISIAAALEIGRRRTGEEIKKNERVSSSQQAFELLQPHLGDLLHEEFWILYLNNSNGVIYKEQLSKGGMTGTLVDVRLVMKQALEHSKADKDITKKLQQAGNALDIKILDHLIIAQQQYLSFADEGIL